MSVELEAARVFQFERPINDTALLFRDAAEWIESEMPKDVAGVIAVVLAIGESSEYLQLVVE